MLFEPITTSRIPCCCCCCYFSLASAESIPLFLDKKLQVLWHSGKIYNWRCVCARAYSNSRCQYHDHRITHSSLSRAARTQKLFVPAVECGGTRGIDFAFSSLPHSQCCCRYCRYCLTQICSYVHTNSES